MRVYVGQIGLGPPPHSVQTPTPKSDNLACIVLKLDCLTYLEENKRDILSLAVQETVNALEQEKKMNEERTFEVATP